MSATVDAHTGMTSVASAATMTLSGLTVGSGSNRGLLLTLQCGSQGIAFPAGLSVVWDPTGANQSLSQVPGTLAADGGITCISALYGLLAPVSGNKNLVISWTGANEMHGAAISFAGVDQTSVAVAFPNGNTRIAAPSTASPCTITITSATGDIAVACHAQNANVWGTIGNQLIGSDDATGPNLAAAANYDNGAATVTLTAAFSGTGGQVSSGCDVLAFSGGGGGGSPVLYLPRRRFLKR